ncbi:MAG: hypothetical protein WBL02_07925 [Methanomethylovorans sp.]|uniref:hypothetical protein n=1 Tax=Methanomethylovorans sp. TaxID=2758717 RepID=UPI003C777F2C
MSSAENVGLRNSYVLSLPSFLEQVDHMEKVQVFIDKLNSRSFRSSDIELLIKQLVQDAKSGKAKVEKEDIQWLHTYQFALQQLEFHLKQAPPTVHQGDWREVAEDVSKVKLMVDEMGQKNIISNVAWNVGGLAIFDITDLACYKEYVYCAIANYIKKLYV